MDRSLQHYFFQPRLSWLSAIAALFTAALLIALCRSVIDHPPTYDELLHMLSAGGVLDSGEPRMADGYYDRAEMFTRLVALTYSYFGVSPVVARIPALLAGAFLVALVVFWTSMRAGLVAGLASGLFLTILPTTIELSVFSRFYTLHGLTILVAAICAFEASKKSGTSLRPLLLGSVSVASISMALHLQITTLIAIGSILTAVVGILLYDLRHRWVPLLGSHPWGSAFIVTGVLLTAIAMAIGLGPVERMGQAPLWSANKAHAWEYYIQQLGRSLPLLWPLFPLAAVASLLRDRHRRIALFCLMFFFAAVVVHSMAAQKAMRYLYYALPFMCIVLGLGFSVAVEKALDSLAKSARRHQKLWLSAVLALAAIAMGLSQEAQLAMRFLAGKPSSLDSLAAYASESDWDTRNLPELATAARAADRVVASAGVKALYYLGRYDYEINASVVMETDSGDEFGLDRRTGRRVISQAESLIEVISRAGETLVVVDNDKIGRSSGVPQAAIDVLEQRCRNLGLPEERLVHAWTCIQK